MIRQLRLYASTVFMGWSLAAMPADHPAFIPALEAIKRLASD